jgi:hypothetical protein
LVEARYPHAVARFKRNFFHVLFYLLLRAIMRRGDVSTQAY